MEKNENKTVTQQNNEKWTQKAAALTAAVFVWQIAAMLLDQKILLASPVDVVVVLKELLFTVVFWKTIGFSMGRILLGFFLAFFLGIGLAVLAGRCRGIKILLWPYLAVMKATPVASAIILLLIWVSSRNISIPVCFCMVFPVVYTNLLTGIEHLDPKLEEMAQVYEIKGIHRFLYIHMTQLKKYLIASVEIGCAMAVKSGIAAEVIGIPAGSIGRQLYDAKIYLATPELFAWTIVLILVSIVLEKGIVRLVGTFFLQTERRLT